MSLLEKYNEVFMNKDEAGMNEVLHDDYKFTMHASGNCLLYTSPSPRDS